MKTHLLAFVSLFLCVQLAAQAPACPPPVGHTEIESGSYSSQPGVNFKLTHFSADLVPEGDTAPMCYGKNTVVSHADILADDQSLTKVFTSKLAKGNSKIRNFKVVNMDGSVTLSGTIKKVVPVKFSITGKVATDGEAIVLHASSIKADGVPVKGLLELFGKNLSSVMKVKNVRGVKIEENTISFKPEQLAHLKGHIAAATSISGALMLRYGSERGATPKESSRSTEP